LEPGERNWVKFWTRGRKGSDRSKRKKKIKEKKSIERATVEWEARHAEGMTGERGVQNFNTTRSKRGRKGRARFTGG